jgi:hypothetical protein
MTGANIEGTMILNGLIEGPLTDDADAAGRLRQWARDLAGLGVDFNVEITGGSFNLLPNNRPLSCAPLGDPPDEAIRQALEQLFEPWPPNLIPRLTSTLRSSEFRKGEEVQSVYRITPDGKVRVEQRTVEAHTETPTQPLSRREIIHMLVFGLVIAAALLGITSLFVDVPALARQLMGTIRPVKVDDVEIDNSNYDAFFHAKIAEINSEAATLKLERTAQFPKDDAALQAAAEAAKPAIKKWLAVAAIAKGSITCEIYDADGKFVGTATMRIEELRKQPDMEVKIPVKSQTRYRLGKIVFTL